MAGLVSSATLIFSAAGGILAGYLCDRIGRRRTLIYTILMYSLASGGSATAHSIPELMFWRALNACSITRFVFSLPAIRAAR